MMDSIKINEFVPTACIPLIISKLKRQYIINCRSNQLAANEIQMYTLLPL